MMNHTYFSHPKSKEKLTLDGLRAFVFKLVADNHSDEAINCLLIVVSQLMNSNNSLLLKLAKNRREKFGSKSEKLDHQQLVLFVEAAIASENAKQENSSGKQNSNIPDTGVNIDTPDKSTSPLPPLEALPPLPDVPETRRIRTGRNKPSAQLTRREITCENEEHELICPICGQHKIFIRNEISEVILFIAAHFELGQVIRSIHACKTCQEGITIAPTPNKPIEKGLPTPALLANVVVSKYLDHMPLFRLGRSYARLGYPVADSTLGSWVGATADLLKPIALHLQKLVLTMSLVGVDDTPLKVLDRSRKPAVRRGHIWAYLGYKDGKPLYGFYAYTKTWKGDEARALLKDYKGKLQGDGYAGYLRLFLDVGLLIIKVGCWAHARRKFKEAFDSGDTRAAEPLLYIQRLYAVERLATKRRASPYERLALRQQYSMPAMLRLKDWMKRRSPFIEPKSLLAKAVTYLSNQWESLQVYLTDGSIPIDNNFVEQQMRPVGLGRKNYLFAGSDEGAERAAILYTILTNCRLAGINPEAYLTDVLERVSMGGKENQLDELLPQNWKPREQGSSIWTIPMTA